MNYIFLLILNICIIFIFCELYSIIYKENFSMYTTHQSMIPWWNGYTNFPWNNMRLGNTNNMSYDLRGDPTIIPKTQFPWNNSSLTPIHNPSI